jgi:hypothetical protein
MYQKQVEDLPAEDKQIPKERTLTAKYEEAQEEIKILLEKDQKKKSKRKRSKSCMLRIQVQKKR